MVYSTTSSSHFCHQIKESVKDSGTVHPLPILLPNLVISWLQNVCSQIGNWKKYLVKQFRKKLSVNVTRILNCVWENVFYCDITSIFHSFIHLFLQTLGAVMSVCILVIDGHFIVLFHLNCFICSWKVHQSNHIATVLKNRTR